MIRRALVPTALLVVFLFAPAPSRAVPMQTTPVELTDAAGVRHRVRLHGDEFFSWMSDLDGHPIARGADGMFRYVEVDPDGRWRDGERLVGSVPPASIGLAPFPPLPRAQIEAWRARRARFLSPGIVAPRQRSRRLDPLKPAGKLHALVIPMGFKDKALQKSREEIQAFFDGPVRDYYLEASAGQVDLNATVVSPLTMNQNAVNFAWNSTYPGRPAWKMFEAGFNYLEEKSFDFTPFDQNGDAFADLVVVVHAGVGREQSGDDGDVHSHFLPFANIPGYPETFTSHDGVKFYGYVTVPEMATGGAITPLGVLVHEAGHYFGLPDLYDTGPSAGSAAGLGGFCLMAYGMWLGPTSGTSPAHPSAWCKRELGWLNDQPLTVSGRQRLAPVQSRAGRVLRVATKDSAQDGNQYFLLENRQRTGFDAYLPGEGLLIFHVDEGQFPAADGADKFNFNADPDHYGIDLEQADGKRELNTTSRRGDATDPFPTADNVDFTPVTTPSSLAYGATGGHVFITDIRRDGGDVTFDFSSIIAPLENGATCERDAFCASGICAGACCEENCEGLCDKACASARAQCPLPEGIACDDGDACTVGDVCHAGACVGSDEVVCQLPDSPCALAAFCDSLTGGCFFEVADDGAPCQVNALAGGSPADEICRAVAGTCQSGACVVEVDLDGEACDDDDLCTVGDVCRAGRCLPGQAKECPAPDECHLAGECDPGTGRCSTVPAFENTPCSGGVCRSGVCVTMDAEGDASGCGCQADSGVSTNLAALLACLGLIRRRRLLV